MKGQQVMDQTISHRRPGRSSAGGNPLRQNT